MEQHRPLAESPAAYQVQHLAPETLGIQLSGQWTLHGALPQASAVQAEIAALPQGGRVTVTAPALTAWDTGLLIFLRAVQEYCGQQQVAFDPQGLPQGIQRLLTLAAAVPERRGSRNARARASLLSRLGLAASRALTAMRDVLTFVGQIALALVQLLRGRARWRWADFMLALQECGAQALPIVSLISLLVGLILAFVGATQLRQFGAQIYVANLVGLAMAREMGAMMTGIIMAGRTGAAFAAQLGTMTVNQEIDAYTTMGISPIEFLVLPRMLALMLMVPLLCLYADLLGILGGAIVGVGLLNLGAVQYYQQTLSAVHGLDFALGLIKGAVFGVLVALAGCLRGMQCGRSASAVGTAATSAVVTAIVWIILSDACLTVLYDRLGL
ncbi:MAG: MlaE family ABC transporter permease [Candidatus Tectimicrobiota bacterium]